MDKFSSLQQKLNIRWKCGSHTSLIISHRQLNNVTIECQFMLAQNSANSFIIKIGYKIPSRDIQNIRKKSGQTRVYIYIYI